MNEERFSYMEQHFLAAGKLECQCKRHVALRRQRLQRRSRAPQLAGLPSSRQKTLISLAQAGLDTPVVSSSRQRLAPADYEQLALFPA